MDDGTIETKDGGYRGVTIPEGGKLTIFADGLMNLFDDRGRVVDVEFDVVGYKPNVGAERG